MAIRCPTCGAPTTTIYVRLPLRRYLLWRVLKVVSRVFAQLDAWLIS